jgi:hypothetical protein
LIALIDLSDWVAQLKNNTSAFSDRVFKSIPDVDLNIDRLQSPVAFVYLSEDASDDTRLGNNVAHIRQKLLATVTVEIHIRRTASATDQSHESAVDLIRTCRTDVFNALVGWKPPDCIRPAQHDKGKLLKKDPRVIKWLDTFTTEIIIQK